MCMVHLLLLRKMLKLRNLNLPPKRKKNRLQQLPPFQAQTVKKTLKYQVRRSISRRWHKEIKTKRREAKEATARRANRNLREKKTKRKKKRKPSMKKRKSLRSVRGNLLKWYIAEYVVFPLNIACLTRKISQNASSG